MSRDAVRRPPSLTFDPSAAIEAIRWLMFSERRPGMVGPAAAIEGVDRKGRKVRLRRSRDEWVLEPRSEVISSNQVARLLAEGEFTPTSVIVTPELAALHFQGAVEQAQASVRELLHAERLLSDPENAGLAEDEDDAFLFILVASSWDKCLRYSSAAVILSVAAAEAQMNEWLESNEAPKTAKSRQHLPLRRKVALILEGSKGGRLSSIEQQEFDAVIALRNRLVHSIPEAESLPLANAPQPGYWLSVEARRACLIVRKVLTRLARSLQQDPPRYLAYCPLVDPADDDEWNRAVLFTGAKEDPDFPPATQLEPPE